MCNIFIGHPNPCFDDHNHANQQSFCSADWAIAYCNVLKAAVNLEPPSRHCISFSHFRRNICYCDINFISAIKALHGCQLFRHALFPDIVSVPWIQVLRQCLTFSLCGIDLVSVNASVYLLQLLLLSYIIWWWFAGLHWINCRLPMNSSSITHIGCRYLISLLCTKRNCYKAFKIILK